MTYRLTDDEGRRLTAIMTTIRPDWARNNPGPKLAATNRDTGLPGINFDHCVRALAAYATQTNDQGRHHYRTPDLYPLDGAYWQTTAPDPSQRTAPRTPCPAHPEDSAGHWPHCQGCWSEIKTGDRPRDFLGKRYEPLDGPDPALRANPHHQTPTPNATESNLPTKHPHPGTQVPPTHF